MPIEGHWGQGAGRWSVRQKSNNHHCEHVRAIVLTEASPLSSRMLQNSFVAYVSNVDVPSCVFMSFSLGKMSMLNPSAYEL